MVNECNSPLECVTKRYSGDIFRSWCFQTGVKSPLNKTGVCDCFSYYGYTGEFCDHISFQTVWTAIIHTIILLVSICGLLLAAIIASRFREIEEFFWKKNYHLLWCLGHIVLSFLFEISYSISAIFMLSDQKYLVHVTFQSVTENAPDFIALLGPTEVFTELFSLYFFLLSILSVVFFWLDILQRTNKVVNTESFERINYLKNTICLIVTIISIFAFFFLIFTFYSSLLICAGCIAGVTVLFTWVCRVLFIRSVTNMKNTSCDAKLQSIVTKIRRYSLFLCLSLTTIGVFLVLYGEFGFDRMLEARPGNFVAEQLPLQLIFILKTWVMFYSLRFIYSLQKNLKERRKDSRIVSSHISA